MKKISKELNKSYRLIIIVFFISYLIGTSFFIKNIYDGANFEIKTTDVFFNYEFRDVKKQIDSGETFAAFFKEALEEAPKNYEMSIVIEYDNEFYSFIWEDDFLEKDDDKKGVLKDTEDIISLTKENEYISMIKSIKFYQYKILKKEYYIDGMKPIKVIIVKDMDEDIERIRDLFVFYIGWILLTLIISFLISRNFYINFMISMKNLKKITNGVNIDDLDENFKVDEKIREIKSKIKYKEFEGVVESYRKMLERLKYQVDSQVEFVNNASHELKTPIFIVSGYINMIKRWGIDDKGVVLDSLNSIEEENKNMSHLVEKLLFLSKGSKELVLKEQILINEEIETIVNDFKIIFPNQKIKIYSEEVSIITDKNLFRQLILNLIENAIKYGRDNLIEIFVEEKENIEITIKDGGVGIPEKELEHIFDKFYKVDKARNIKGYGLGLSIVKNIIKALEAKIYYTSEENIGTEVKIILKK